ncbi:DNA polymerase III subunit chi [Gilvimarinus sp. F26214L]|uniref:DNA polymerase III subunit chi n=1 Tax=Gilvimarinus sp. DZF01 TaxID=3461371 RepID=UPI00404632E9
MPQVDFYILESDSLAARHQFVARLLGKLQRLGKSALVTVASDTEATELDALLWAFPPESFLPHGVVGNKAGEDAPEEAVLISARPDESAARDVFVNLRQQVPSRHRELGRIVEVVVQDPVVLAGTRENFRFYRQQGYPIESHSIRE